VKDSDYILDQWNELKQKLESRGIVINDSGAKNDVILAMSACFYEGTSVGERNGQRAALTKVQELMDTYREDSLLDIER